MEKWNSYKLDGRTKEELEAEIKRLSESYVPEWKFDRENPDAGSVIAIIFAGQMAENIQYYNLSPGRFQQEFAKLLGMCPKPARPAFSIVVMKLDEGGDRGIDIRSGTGFQAETKDEGEPVIFRTFQDIHAVSANLVQILQVSGEKGKLIPLNKNFSQPPLLGKIQYLEDAERINTPFRVFDSSLPGITRNAVVLYHSFGMNTNGEILYLHMEGSYDKKGFAEALCKKEHYQFSYYAQGEICPVEEVWQEEECVCLKKHRRDQKIEAYGAEYNVLIIERLTPLKENISIKKLEFFPEKGCKGPDFICSDQQELPHNHTPVFGQELSLYQNCYLGQEQIFEKKGASITISFCLSFREKIFLAGIPEEVEVLPVIKRRKRKLHQESRARVMVQEMTLCYYNGTGWKNLPCDTDISELFAREENAGEWSISFRCPKDWKPVTAGAYQQHCLRLQIVRSDDCYYRPASHLYPVLSELKFSYEYTDCGLVPDRVEQRCGMKCCDITQQIEKKLPATVFKKSFWKEDALLLGLDKVPGQGPVSIYFQLENHVAFSGFPLTFSYSTRQGFSLLKVVDGTQGFQKSGIIMFLPAGNMQTMEIAGRECFWIKIARAQAAGLPEYAPLIHQIYLNGIQVQNVRESEEEEYYIDHAEPNMSFALPGNNILSAEVWVNEVNRLSEYQMEQMRSAMPEEVQAEYDVSGNIAAFYVKWQETETFDDTNSKDRHYQIDRLRNRIRFGDGVGQRIPEVTQDTAFKVKLYTCQGDRGNVEAGTIQNPLAGHMFLKEVWNPLAAAGGSSQEEESHMYQRAGNWFAGGERLVSEQDFERAVLEFSEQVDKVRCIAGTENRNLKDRQKIRIILLMKEFEQGSMAFYKIQGLLKEELLSRCEIGCSQGEIEILEPIYVKISMDIWIELNHMEEMMKVQEEIKERVFRFFHPLSGSQGAGWEIGQLPSENQIQMMLNTIHTQANIVNHSAVFTYTDHAGKHETGILAGETIPMAVCMNGEHRVHVIPRRRRERNDL